MNNSPDVSDLMRRLIIAEATIHAKETEIASLKNRLLSSSLDGVVMTNPNLPDNPLTYVNAVFEKMTGYTKEEVLGKNSRFLQGSDREQPELKEIHEAIKEKRECRVTLRNYKKDGTTFWNELSITPVFDNNGNITSFIGVLHDITKEKEVDRMKTEFISLASHQLRTPLSAMKWFCELLLSGDAGTLNNEQKEYIQNIAFSNDRMISLVGDLLNISRIESGRIMIEPKPTDLVALITEALQVLKEKADKKKISVTVQPQGQIPLIKIDPNLIREVYSNLISNAIKYTPVEGHIAISLSIRGSDVLSQISDTGYGIPEAEQHRIFDKFFRATNVSKIVTDGTGLGLYLVKALVETSKGKIWFQSAEGKGTSFFFTLPLQGLEPKTGEVSISNAE